MTEEETTPTAPQGAPLPEDRRGRLRVASLLFVIGVVGLALPAWERVLQPSPHFHFVDLAESFLHGRLDTDTPNRHRQEKPPSVYPPGLQEAIDRHLTDGNGAAVGFNDWCSYRTIDLKGDEVVEGVYPWKDEQGAKKTHFLTLDGVEMVIDPDKDVERGCFGAGWRRCVRTTTLRRMERSCDGASLSGCFTGLAGIGTEVRRSCKRHDQDRCDRTHHFVSFPPFPAVAILPVVSVVHYGYNDVIFTILLGALNLVLLFLLLESMRRRGLSTRSRKENALLAVLFTFGTVHYFSAVRGEVWFTALILGVTLNLAYIWAAIETRRPLLAGIFLALGMATRTPIAFCFVFFALQLFFPGGSWSGSSLGEKFKKGVLFALPILAVGITLMLYNHARFGDPFEFGHTYLLEGTRASIRDHGLFSWHFLNHNLSAALTNLPRIDSIAPYLHITRHGLGLLATTPFFLLLLWPRRDGWTQRHRFLHLAIWVTVAVAAVPSLFYQNTGWAQFGYRFALDYMPFLIALLAVGDRPLTRRVKGVVVFAIAVNLFGAITFGRFPFFYS